MLTIRYVCDWFDMGTQRACSVELSAGTIRRRWAVSAPLERHQHPERIVRTDYMLRCACQRIVMRYLGAA